MIFTDIPPPPEEEKEKKPEPKYQARGAFKSPLAQKHTPERLKETKLAERPEEVTFTLLERGDQGFDLAVDLDRGKIAKALEIYKGVSPDVAAKAQTIAKERGIPFDLVNGNMDAWQSWQEARDVLTSLFDTDTQGRYKYPFTANWLSNPAKMAVSRDDVEALRQIEGLLIANKPLPVQMIKQFVEAYKGSVRSYIETVKGYHEFLGPLSEKIPGAAVPFLPPGLSSLAAVEKTLGAQGQKAVTESLEALQSLEPLQQIPIPRADAPLSNFLNDWAANMPQIVQGVVTSYLGGSPMIGSALMYARIFGPTYKELIEKGVDRDRAFIAANVHAAAESALEYGGLYAWMEMLKTTGTKDIFVGVARTMAVNWLQEFLQEHTEAAAMIWGEAEKKGQTLEEQIQAFLEMEPETAKQGAYAGAISAFTVLLAGGMKLPYNYAHMKMLDQDIAFWDGMNQITGQSKTFERAPEQGAEFIDTVTKQAKGRESFFVSLDALNTLFQDDPRQVDKFLRDLDVKDQLGEAVTAGKEIEIKISKWLEKYAGSDLSLRLRENIRFDPRGMTLAERATINEEIKGELETIQKNYQELIEQNRLPKQFLDMRDKLIASKEEGGAGMKAEDADAELSVFLAGATVLSRKGGETLEQWFSRVNPALEVGGEYVGGTGKIQLQKKDFSKEKKLYVIFSNEKPEKHEKSIEHVEGGEEKGLSVYDVIENYGNEFLISGGAADIYLEELSRNRKAWLLKGNIVGTGYDGESLIDNIEVLSELKYVKNKIVKLPQAAPGTPPRGSVTFADGQTLINLYKSADMSTFIHESGHLFFNEMGKLVKSGKADAQLRADYLKLLRFAYKGPTPPPAGTRPPEGREIPRALEGEAEAAVKFPVDDFTLASEIYDEIQAGEAGQRAVIDTSQEVGAGYTETRGIQSTFPEYFRGKGYTKKETLKIIQKVLDGKELTSRQQDIYDDLLEGKKHEMADQAAAMGLTLADLAKKEVAPQETPPVVETEPQGEVDTSFEFGQNILTQYQGNLPSDDDIDFEKIAKAFEEYIKEGRAPSPELIGSFRRLKNWLSAIYKALRGLDIEIDDEVRGVFDRLLAAEEDIKAVSEYYNTRRSIEEFMELDEQQKAALAERRGKAQESAIDAQVRRYLRAYYKALGGKKEITKQATDEINNLPVYQAIDDAVGKDGLSFEGLKWEYGIDAVKELSQKHKGLVSKKGTVLLRDLAATYGFDSEAAMFEALVAAETKKEAIAARTKEIMDNTEAAIREDLAKQEEVAGEEALHTDENLEYQIAQAELLAQKIEREGKKKIPRPKNVTAKAYKDAAEAILADKTVALATRYDLFAKAEQRYAKEVWDALKKGDDEAAHAAWQKQILNHALVQAAVKARDERGKIIRRAKRIGNTKPEKIEFPFREAILALIERYGIGTPKMIPQRPEEVNIPALIASISDVEYAPAIPDWIQGMQGAENFRDLKFRQFQELNDAIVALYNAGRKDIRAKYLSEAIKERLGLEGEVLVNELTPYLAEPMEKLKSRHPVDEHHWFSGVQKLGRTILADLGLANIWVQEMDGYEGIGPHGVTGPNEIVFMRTLAYADSEKKSIWDSRIAPRLEKDGDLLKGIRAIYNRMKKDPGLGKKFTIPNVPLGVDPDIRLRMEQLGRNLWTPERIIMAALNMGNEKNQRALMGGYGWSDEHIQMIQAMLTADEWQTIQHLWDFVNEFYYPMDEVYFRLNGCHTNKEPARSFDVVTADGQSITLKGGYFPLMFDQALSDRAARHQEEDLFKNRTDAIFHNASTKSGFSKSRKGSTLPPKLDISVLYTHLSDVAHYITHAEAVRDLNRITLDPEWKSMVIEKFGVETYQQFREMLRYVARPQHGPVSGIDRIATRWRKLATLYALGYNLKSGMRQTLSMSSAAQEIGWNWADRGIGQLIRHPQQLFDQVNELSSYMANQARTWDREVQEQLQSIKPFARNIEIAGRILTLKDAQDTAFVFVRGFDKITRYAAWSGAYQKFMAENAGLPIEQRMTKAAGYADDIVAKTQPSARAMDLSHWQRGEGLGRLLNMFMTWTLKYGHRTRAYFRGWHEGQITTKDYARHVVNEQLIPAMGATAIAMGWAWATGKDDDDDKELTNEFLYTGVNQLLSGYPLLRDIPGAIRYPYYNNFLSVPAFQAAGSKHLKSITQGYKLFTGDDPLDERAADLAYALALSVEFEMGVPAIKVYRDLLNAYNAHVGD